MPNCQPSPAVVASNLMKPVAPDPSAIIRPGLPLPVPHCKSTSLTSPLGRFIKLRTRSRISNSTGHRATDDFQKMADLDGKLREQ